MKIEELLTRPEAKTLEFKQDMSSPKNILKTLTAFANTAGGDDQPPGGRAAHG